MGVAKELTEDPQIWSEPPGGGEFGLRRLFQTTVARVEIDANVTSSRIVLFDDDGWAITHAWTRRTGADPLAAVIHDVGIPELEARRIAEEVEPVVERRRPPPRPPSYYRRQATSFCGAVRGSVGDWCRRSPGESRALATRSPQALIPSATGGGSRFRPARM